MSKTNNDRSIIRQFLKEKYKWLPPDRRFKVIEHVYDLFEELQRFNDRNFIADFMSGDENKYQQRYWELWLFNHLTSIGYRPDHHPTGPDFEIVIGGRRAWIEAVAPTRGDDGAIDKHYADELRNRGGYFQPDIFQLRLTQSVSQKIEGYRRYIGIDVVNQGDICVIALNWWLLGSLGMRGKSSSYNSMIDILFGVGPRFVQMDHSGAIVKHGYQFEPTILKGSSTVSKRFFLDWRYNQISAVIASSANPLDLGDNLIFAVHNPYARNKLPIGRIGAQREYYAEKCGANFVLRRL